MYFERFSNVASKYNLDDKETLRLFGEYVQTGANLKTLFSKKPKLRRGDITEDIVDLIKDAVVDEFIASKQYELDAEGFEGKIKKEYLKHAKEERKHASDLIDILLFAGDIEIDMPELPDEISYDINADILMYNLMLELKAIEDYKLILEKLRRGAVYSKIEKILKDEIEHAEDNFSFLKRFEDYTVGVDIENDIIRRDEKDLRNERAFFEQLKVDYEELGRPKKLEVHTNVNFHNEFNVESLLQLKNPVDKFQRISFMIEDTNAIIKMYEGLLEKTDKDTDMYKYYLAILFFRRKLLEDLKTLK